MEKKHRRRRISGVFEIRAASPAHAGSTLETAGSNPAQRTAWPLAPEASEICLVLAIDLFDNPDA